MKKTVLRSLAAIAATTIMSSAAFGAYKIIARNDLGMHCACPTFSGMLILPPYNTVRAQVLMTGSDNPTLLDGSYLQSNGMTLTYSMAEETTASLQTDPYFSSWINYSPKIFPGFQPIVNGVAMGLAGNGITGTMTYDAQNSLAFIAAGIPAYPVVTGNSSLDIMTDPLGGPKRDPFITANIALKDHSGNTLATTSTVVPVAFAGCCTCHIPLAQKNGYPATAAGSFAYLGKLHSQNPSGIDFSYIDPDGDGQGGPIRCSWCHWDPAMGESAAPGLPNVWPNYKILPGANFTSANIRVSQYSLSDVIHRFHTQDQVVLTQYDANIANNCYDCHPGNGVNCYRGAHKAKTAIWCSDCHGNLNQRVAAGQLTQPWQESTLPSCWAPGKGITSAFTCHSQANYPAKTSWSALFGYFINSNGHEGGVLCETCHGSAHAEAPSTMSLDNVENSNLQGSTSFSFPSGKDKTYAIGVCNVCHTGKSNTWQVPPHTGL